MSKLLAASVRLPFFEGIGPLGQESSPGTYTPFANPLYAGLMFEKVLSLTIGVMTVVAGIWFIFSMLTAAIQWIGGGSDKQAIQNAQKKIANSIVGLFITVASYLIIVVIGKIVGLDIVNVALAIFNLHP